MNSYLNRVCFDHFLIRQTAINADINSVRMPSEGMNAGTDKSMLCDYITHNCWI